MVLKFIRDFAIANVQCQYDSASDAEADERVNTSLPTTDHNYDMRDEPPAFVITHYNAEPQSSSSLYNINKRIRRSEVVLRQAADCVSRGLTFQTVSEQFNIPISTIRFFMARKGILPQRRRGRTTQLHRACSSPEPPYHMQHYKLPDMVAFKHESDEESNKKD
ncbi:hypothetical protein K1T71_001002 [Dendrolimus kikuchii]|uniref:Uncharacterized protein n=1 Tax=Dendrolimus kikuchii TaxID=765133 RepID=A0ACC1DGK8_9NEOP|nr:hypothetical protein K1T71_001002 [Dendrolimus kikuchii]